MRGKASRADENLHRKIASRRRSNVTKFFRSLTCLGSLTFGTLLTAALSRSGEKDTARSLGMAIFGSRAFVYLLKQRIKRERPEDSVVSTRTPSFPSGHTATAFAAATVLKRKKGLSSNFLYGLAGLVGLSRVYLGAHYLTDVAVGSVIGRIIGRMSA